MSITREIAEVLLREKHDILRRGYSIRTDQVTAMLRVEVSCNIEMAIAADRRDASGILGWASPHQTPTIVGVSVYQVRDDLPAPGWRIINPLKVTA